MRLGGPGPLLACGARPIPGREPSSAALWSGTKMTSAIQR
jgi:hypothetical protein